MPILIWGMLGTGGPLSREGMECFANRCRMELAAYVSKASLDAASRGMGQNDETMAEARVDTKIDGLELGRMQWEIYDV